MWSLQDDCEAQRVKHGLSSEEKKIYTFSFIYQFLTVIYVLYDNMENCPCHSSTAKIKYVSRYNPYYK